MTLQSGSRLGPYEIITLIGAGGMGEVYKAKDTRLDRTVAIKVLPSHLSDDSERRERFEREARAVSSLNHPHICTLHDVGEQDDTHFLIMEYIEGETLADRLKKGPLPLEQALRYAVEIADALDKAHRAGVVHRDLKPGNIMLTKSGAKLLDFGLAKLRESEKEDLDLSALPTAQKPLTEKGAILGTFQYMAPEQLEGKDADSRSDIFAFGAALYEMMTGRKAFEGKSQASLIAAILEHEPVSLTEQQPLTPPALERLVKRCLSKDPDDRWQTARDLCEELRWIGQGASQAPLPSTKGSQVTKWAMAFAFGALLAGIATWSMKAPKPTATSSTMRLAITLPDNQQLSFGASRAQVPFALSPYGENVVYVVEQAGQTELHFRALDSYESTPIPGTEGASGPFFSPDGQQVGFFADGKLQKISIGGGPPTTICNASPQYLGASWGPDDTVVFVSGLRSGLRRVSAGGGTPEEITFLDAELGETSHRWPQVLQNGEGVIYSAGTGDQLHVAMFSFRSKRSEVLLQGIGYARYLPSGHLVYADSEVLMAAPFDLEQRAITGPAVPVVEGVVQSPGGGASFFTVASTGTLLYARGGQSGTLVWVDRRGVVTPLSSDTGPVVRPEGPRFSPDGAQLAFGGDNGTGLWVLDFARGTWNRISDQAGSFSVWHPAGKKMAHIIGSGAMVTEGVAQIFLTASDGSTSPERLIESTNPQFTTDWSPDGSALAFYEIHPETQRDIWMLPSDGKPTPFLVTPFNERGASFSPDGRYISYVSDESGRDEIYVRPFPEGDGKHILSTSGGREPRWSREGKELFYRIGDRMMAVDVETRPEFRAGKPYLLFEGRFHSGSGSTGFPDYDVAPSGDRFIMIRGETMVRTQIQAIINWTDELERLAPSDE